MSNWDEFYKNKEGNKDEPYIELADTSPESGIMVSVICLTYNHERFLEYSLNSMIQQITDFEYEIIVHDDASTDGTVAIINKYYERFPSIIVPIIQRENQLSKGVSCLKKYVLPKCRGKYVAIVAGDDAMCDNYRLQRQVEILENRSNISMCVAKVQYINADGDSMSIVKPEDSYGFKKGIVNTEVYCKNLWAGSQYPFHTSSYLFSRKMLIQAYNHPIAKYRNLDQVLLRIALIYGEIYYDDTVFAYRRILGADSFKQWYNSVDEEQKNSFRLNAAIGDAIFDRETNRKFHSYIAPYVYRESLPSLSKNFDKVLNAWILCNIHGRDLRTDYKKRDILKYYFARYLSIFAKMYFRLKSEK